jgi:hypothetical protein
MSLKFAMKEEQIGTESRFKVYPIPAIDFLNIESGIAETTRLLFELFNNAGVRIYYKTMPNLPLLQINITDIPAGVYLLKVSLPSPDQLLWVKKILKN